MGWIGFGKADDPAIGDIEFGYAIGRKYRGNMLLHWNEDVTQALREKDED